MSKPDANREKLSCFYGPNLGYVIELYEKYLEDPDLVAADVKEYFDEGNIPVDEHVPKHLFNREQATQENNSEKIVAALRLADYIRGYGHLSANVSPLKESDTNISIEQWGLTYEDLVNVPVDLICSSAPSTIKNGAEAINYLKKVYTNSIAFEYHHVHDFKEKNWLREQIENGRLIPNLNKKKKQSLLKRLTEVEEFEKFIHRTFVGQKRFSIEGLESMVPLIDEVISESVKDGVSTVNIGMAHRGRLNVLAHVLGKPYERIFAEFQHAPIKDLVPSEGSVGINFGWTGDVKYHLGLDRQIKSENTANVRLTLANNPSHLEFVGAVVEGFTRAAQEERYSPGYPLQNSTKALSILIHGDAAFPGQGIVAETLNLSRLPGYQTGGTIHIIANNTIGFTTESQDSRSTRYASDLAKGYEIPIVHVNADDPEAVIMAAKLATTYRAKFGKDFLIDLIGYRRYGHNEMDEPMTTNPLMYKIIHQHPTVKTIYAGKLLHEEVIDKNMEQEMLKVFQNKLSSSYEKVPKKIEHQLSETEVPDIVEKELPTINTAVPLDKLRQINEDLLKWPNNFNVFAKLERILKRRKGAFGNDRRIDWALAETAAIATIIADGTPIRLTGQDSERGTFAHRNLVLHEVETGNRFSPLHTLSSGKASFAIYNSPLSEAAVLAFEYGYNVFAPETLVLWEAQYGDFANAAQVIFDQFIAAGRAKWGQKSGLVMLLPHGYEGQGPEHSSARFERFLTLAAENNWTIANLTTAAQYFHILRRQAAILQEDIVRPLVLMTPKSLLRNPLVSSMVSDLTDGEFQPVISQPGLGLSPSKVERIVMCTGKMAVDLAEKVIPLDHDWLQIFRIEEIYPFPINLLKEIFKQYPNVKEVVWVQEEPKNMGAWTFVEPRINDALAQRLKVTYIGRRRRSSPAEGEPGIHKMEQARIIENVFTRK
ncbi:2-oxoglutarate dehydrogenase E1 component [Bacillus sp. B15-48]|uniref:2-oxoglutarate dehydrogenase E1 component n=1 Tax=Bacillus sp. B15-48 TaxID=1548601 RepID=UPI00193FA605|nr:2-oxoglutarate dehydrogenase E1 component [Bacillus sp. B15-48]MBM4761963.1 2-oxoglutarate dehydrogenase E1 component [Bacillus sp. B15-48]